jgi:chromosome partitioning protein
MVIAVTNLKGGVGKTTIAINIAVSLIHKGYKTCVVDTDTEQRSSVKWAGQRDESAKTLPVFAVGEKLNREVEMLNADYDFVIIDGTPQLSERANRTILASDLILIPISTSGFDFWSFENFVERYEQAKAFKSNVEAFILLNKFNGNRNISRDVLEALSDFDNIPMLETTLAERVAYQETTIQGLGVVEYKDKKAKDEIDRLTNEILIKANHFLSKNK